MSQLANSAAASLGLSLVMNYAAGLCVGIAPRLHGYSFDLVAKLQLLVAGYVSSTHAAIMSTQFSFAWILESTDINSGIHTMKG